MKPQIFVLKNVYGLTKSERDFFMQYVDDAKKERIAKNRFPEKGDGILLADILCKTAILKFFGIPIESQHFVYLESGKPILEGHSHIHFNWSHSGSYIACAVSDRPIGIDIEKIGNFSEKVADRVCSYEEYQTIIQSDEKASLFTKIWTQKEAIIKLHGTGIAHANLKTCLNGALIRSQQIENYWISVAEA